ncbi:Protein of unknown function [Mucilaginibacter mallensis]|uniref:DUF2975 domain-containing protein n=1 Tax=Mucilaginibacter mallensis TaxID=652787 RepID=A0A1H1TVG7_MUCMA|nr:DUF2975 domain-containing protein [Mucilaginibacter mallensis]SDS64182.1 Protein of unknown function [Mucilaginibacter mallensis]
MKRVRLLQVAVYIVFAALFFQNAAPGLYQGLMDSIRGDTDETGVVTSVLPGAAIDPRLIPGTRDENMQVNNNYSLEDISINANVRVNAKFINTSSWLFALSIILTFVGFSILASIAYIINKVIYSIYEGSIFESKHLEMIRRIGLLLIVYTIVDYGFQQAAFYISKSLINSPVTILNASAYDFEVLICGLLVLIVAEAFKQGAQLKEEQELTI